MAIRAILFTRVSSVKQDFERQISDLKPLAYSDGYSDGEIAIIKHKESATKNNISNRKSIAELKDLIDNNDIKTVYVSEISRLSRRNDVLYSVLSLLEEKKICLTVQQPMLIRTIENGKQNHISSVIISFMSYLAVSEGEIRNERVKSGKIQKTLEGRIVSSQIKFGYDRSDTNHAVINQEQANVIIDIFQSYLNGSTTGQLWSKYEHSGVFPRLKKSSGEGRVIKILKDPTYIGENKHYQYPQIIQKELFEKVQEEMKTRAFVKGKTKFVYYCQGLIKYEGRTLTPHLAKSAYTFHDVNTNKRVSININVIDSLAFNNSCEALSASNEITVRKRKENASESLKLVELKLSNMENEFKELEEEQERLNYQFQKGRLSLDRYEFNITKVEEEIGQLLKEKEMLNVDKLSYQKILNSDDVSLPGVKDYYTLLSIQDDVKKQELVKQAIESINIEEIGKQDYRITFNFKDRSLNDKSYYRYIVKGCKICLYQVLDEHTVIDLSNTWEKRITK